MFLAHRGILLAQHSYNGVAVHVHVAVAIGGAMAVIVHFIPARGSLLVLIRSKHCRIKQALLKLPGTRES